MKRLLIIAVFAMGIVATGSAQKSNLSKAKNKALNVESPDFEGAKEAIQAALQDESTKNEVITWYTAGLVYEKIQDAEYLKEVSGRSADATLKGESAITSYAYYIKAYDMDFMPNTKGKVKPKYSKKIKNSIKNYYVNMAFLNYGITEFNKKNFPKAIEAFEIHTGVPDLQMFSEDKPFIKDTVFYQIRYYTALAYERSDSIVKAMEIFEQLKDKGYEEIFVNQHLSDLYKEQKDTVNYLRTLEEGYKRYPNEFFFLGNLINFYIFNNEEQKGIDYLNKAIELDPNNAQYYNVKGSVMETLNRTEEAAEYYDKALTLNPTLMEAFNNKGRMIYNEAYKLEDKSVSTRDPQGSAKLKAAALEKYKESLPYFEKAAELKPTNMENLVLLRSIYYRLLSIDTKTYQPKYDEMNAKIKAL
ncbi:MAG TPA: tetratricopeptide repeat protein [Paludibacteraceae bacterium]|nr:tetratricopeptide repeat protein [Paludibacteraceae bacterium]